MPACQPASGSAEPGPATPTVETLEAKPAPPAGAIVLGGVAFSQPLRALGTEPFWGVEIQPDGLIYSGVDRPEMKMTNPGPSFQNGTSVIAAMHPVGQAFTVTLRATECSDGMSDRVCPLEAEILHKGETLKGCANSEAALDALPKP